MASASTRSRKALDRALALHRTGDLAEAERLYRAVLDRNGGNVDALHLLGLLHAQRGDLEGARQHFDRALGLDPARAELHFLRAEVLSGLGLQEQAIGAYREALSIRPEFPEALINLGDLLLRKASAADALPLLERAVQIRPGDGAALVNQGNALQALRRHAEALLCYDRALVALPGNADVLNNRANALLALTRFAEAEASCRSALAQRADHAYALLNLGRAQSAQGRIEDGLRSYDAALVLLPGDFNGWCERAMLLAEQQQYREAQESFEKALALQPDASGTWSDLGVVLIGLRAYPQALAACDRALALDEDNAKAWANRALALGSLKRHEEAIAAYETALQIDPQTPYAPGALAWRKRIVCDWREHAAFAERIERGISAGERTVEPFPFLFLSDRAEYQLDCARIYVRDKYPPRGTPLWSGERYRHQRIRLAYVSADFREHATSHLLAGLLEKHDRSRFEVFGISIGPVESSPMASRIRAAFEHFMHVHEQADTAIAALLRSREIDIAVDLMGFTTFCRPGVFAMRPCPVQVNYLGFPATTGAPYIDYIIADRQLIPVGEEGCFAEKVVYLPDTYQVNDSKRPIAERALTRAEAGLPRGAFVFCCFNQICKITSAVFDVWMRLLIKVPGSVLWLLEDNAAASCNLRREAQSRGVASDRIIFARRANADEHLARQRLADLFLDTLPYNAHTTASDALWAGLPLITCRGATFAGRVASSLLCAVGLPELITHSLEEYEARALELATSPGPLAELRAKLARNRTTRPLFDTDRFRTHIEAAYAIMWQRCQTGEPPAAFAIPAIEQA
jgi:predicted O-linked N-acetylglucosamine transferase (SPINDLY family)